MLRACSVLSFVGLAINGGHAETQESRSKSLRRSSSVLSKPTSAISSKPVLAPTLKPVTTPTLKPVNAPTLKPTTYKPPPTLCAPYREPVILKSQNGVLEVILYVRQGQASLNTVHDEVDNFLVFDWELVKGTSSDGQTSGKNMFPAPTLNVYPTEVLTIYVVNELQNLNIKDLFTPQLHFTGQNVPLFPEAMTESPLNLHLHGSHVSPEGNQDNILAEIPAGKFNRYSYTIPNTMPYGLLWYHSHRHRVSEMHTARGLAGMVVIGTVDGGLPIVTENKLATKTMSIQVTNVFGRAQGLNKLTNHFITSFANTEVIPTEQQLKQGTYKPVLAPFNFLETPSGTSFVTEWFAGPNTTTNPNNNRGYMQYIPTNLKTFTSKYFKLVFLAISI